MEARTSLRMGPRQKKEEQKEGKQVGADCQENQVYLLGVSFDGLCTVTLEAFLSISFYIKKSCVKKIETFISPPEIGLKSLGTSNDDVNAVQSIDCHTRILSLG